MMKRKRIICLINYIIIGVMATSIFAQNPDSLNSISNRSTFEMLERGQSLTYKTIEYTYNLVQFNTIEEYLAKFKITTIKSTSTEGQDRLIEVNISPIEDIKSDKFVIKQKCDILDLYGNYYKTTKYGCCSASDLVCFYDYSNKLIISGSNKIIEYLFPNNDIKCYISYQDPNNDKSMGYINISYDSNKKYKILLTGDNFLEKDSDGNLLVTCPDPNPDIKIISESIDKNYKDEKYTFWSMQNIESTSELNFLMEVSFDCKKSILPIKIPIISGKPFGKDIEFQEYKVIQK